MSQSIGPNRVPADPIVSAVRGYLEEEGKRLACGSFSTYPITLLAERADINADTLQKLLDGHMKTVDFDVADQLLCVMHMTALWRTDLHEVYEQAYLEEGERQFKVGTPSGVRVCARRGCSVKFIPPKHSPRKRYCSKNCRSTAWKHKVHPPKTMIYGKDRNIQKLVCRNGHERTKENTGIQSTGYRYCLICHRAAASEYDRRRRGTASPA